MNYKLETHDDFNQLMIRAIKANRRSRSFETARRILSHLRLMRKLQKQIGV